MIIIEKDIFRFEAESGSKMSDIIQGSSLNLAQMDRRNDSVDSTAQAVLEFCKTS